MWSVIRPKPLALLLNCFPSSWHDDFQNFIICHIVLKHNACLAADSPTSFKTTNNKNKKNTFIINVHTTLVVCLTTLMMSPTHCSPNRKFCVSINDYFCCRHNQQPTEHLSLIITIYHFWCFSSFRWIFKLPLQAVPCFGHRTSRYVVQQFIRFLTNMMCKQLCC